MDVQVTTLDGEETGAIALPEADAVVVFLKKLQFSGVGYILFQMIFL